jgi:hypothetical protein
MDACDSTAGDVLARFEDRDEPIASLADPASQLAEAFGALDPQEEDAEVQMIRALTTYLAFHRDQVSNADDDLLSLAARAEWVGNPPGHVRAWLEERDVDP